MSCSIHAPGKHAIADIGSRSSPTFATPSTQDTALTFGRSSPTNALWLTGNHLAADIYTLTGDLEDHHIRHHLICSAHTLSVSLKPTASRGMASGGMASGDMESGDMERVSRARIHQLCNGLTVLLATHQTTLMRHGMPTREWLSGIEAIRVLIDVERDSDAVRPKGTGREMHAIVLPVH